MKTTQKRTGLFRLMIPVIFFLLNSFTSRAQVGVIVLDEGDNVPYSQWYMVRDDSEENTAYIFDEDALIQKILLDLLKPYNLKLKDASIDDEGDPFFYLDNSNGYESYVWYLKEDDGMTFLQVTTLRIEEKE